MDNVNTICVKIQKLDEMKFGSDMFHPRSVHQLSMFTFKAFKTIQRLKMEKKLSMQ